MDDINFVNPVIKRGASHPNLTIYGIIIKKCENNDFRKIITVNVLQKKILIIILKIFI